jgi:hypothetical protein
MTTDDLPTTIEASVRLVLGLMPEDEHARITALSRADLATLHLGLGLWMRNHLGLWNGNQALLDATGKIHPDEASEVLVEALWQHLQDRRPRLH